MMDEGYIGIDVGTQGLKAVVINHEGRVLMTTFSEYPTSSPQSGWTEQDPGDWDKALKRALEQIAAEHLSVTYKGVGVTGQMHTTVVCDDNGNPLYPAILWSDQRTASYSKQLERKYGLDQLLEITGNQPLSNFSLLRLLWIRDHEPDCYRQIRHVAVAKDWVRFLLTGDWATDVTDASGTYLLDVKNRRWASDFMASLDIPATWWGQVVESSQIVGTMRYGPAEFHGLPVVAGAGDQEASAVGTGIAAGDLGISLGTSGVLFRPLDRYQLPPHPSIHAFCHAESDTWHWMSVTQSAALSLRWLRDSFFPEKSYAEMDTESLRVKAGADGLTFLPFLNGERAPIMKPLAQGGFLGISSRHGREHFARAVLEGVAYSLKHCYVTMDPNNTLDPHRIIMTGGGAKSSLWTQIFANVMNRDIVVADDPGAAVGAAWLARSGITGVKESMPVRQATVKRPITGDSEIYAQGFSRYERVVTQLLPLWDEDE